MTVSDEIIKVLDTLGKKFGVAIDWAGDNIIPYVEQLCQKYIKWEISTSIAWIVIGALAIILALALGIWADGFNADELSFMFCIGLLMAGIAVIGVQVFDIIECNVFPEKAIFEKISTMIQTMK